MPTKKSVNRRPRLSIRSRAPKASSAAVRRVMQANTGRTTEPERKLRAILHGLGLRFRVDTKPELSLRCAADLVFRPSMVCVFVDGCYWHGCPLHFSVPKQNSAWWAEKIADNRRRDKKRTAELEKRGWLVVRLWEHELGSDTSQLLAARIAHAVRKRRPPLTNAKPRREKVHRRSGIDSRRAVDT